VVFPQEAVTEGWGAEDGGIRRGQMSRNESIAEPLDRKGTVNVARLLYVDEEGGIGRKWTSKGPVVKLPCYAPGETWWYRRSMQNRTQIGIRAPVRQVTEQ
jgi:hypothetical protein